MTVVRFARLTRALVLLAICPSPSTAQVADPRFPCVAIGGVAQVVSAYDRIYLGGVFETIGRNTGGGVPVSASGGALVRPYAQVTGEVYACVPDGGGGWYIGGHFVAVNGRPRGNLARILPGGRVASWAPEVDGPVNALALGKGVLYVGGVFSMVCGTPRPYLAAISSTTAGLLSWNPSIDGIGDAFTAVNALLLRNDTLYVAGDFTTLGGQARRNLAAVDLASGGVTPFAPNPDRRMWSMAIAGDLLVVGGQFYSIAGTPRHQLAGLELRTGALAAWGPELDLRNEERGRPLAVKVLTVVAGRVLIGGHFASIAGQPRWGLAAVEVATGALSDWNPRPAPQWPSGGGPTVNALATSGDVVYVGGEFDSLGGAPRMNAGAVSCRSGQCLEWNPGVTDEVRALACAGGEVFVGGDFRTIWDWEPRSGLAAIDPDNGAVLDWAPRTEQDGMIEALAVADGVVYVGGFFSTVNGEARYHLAALDAQSGDLLPWNPGTDGPVWALAARDGRVYIGGDFRTVAGQPQRNLAVVDAAQGRNLPWPIASNAVLAITLAESTVFVGGTFQEVGGVSRRTVAALDLATGQVTPWDPQTEGTVLTIAVGRDKIYVGGGFDSLGGVPRSGMGAVDRVTGAAVEWNPQPQPELQNGVPFSTAESVIEVGGAVYIAGSFREIGGAERLGVAAVDTAGGAALDWNPDIWPGHSVGPICIRGERVYVGGAFSRMGLQPTSAFAVCDGVQWPRPGPVVVARGHASPNPASSSTEVSFTLSRSALVSLRLFDAQGRRVATIAEPVARPTGAGRIGVSVGDLAPGCYIYRVEAEGCTASGKIVVTR